MHDRWIISSLIWFVCLVVAGLLSTIDIILLILLLYLLIVDLVLIVLGPDGWWKYDAHIQAGQLPEPTERKTQSESRYLESRF